MGFGKETVAATGELRRQQLFVVPTSSSSVRSFLGHSGQAAGWQVLAETATSRVISMV